MPKFCLANKRYPLLAGLFVLFACGSAEKKADSLPILGPMELITAADGSVDTIFYPFPDFVLEDQYGMAITPDSLKGQILVVDFFFSSCPTICKDLLRNMRRVNEKFGSNQQLRLLSHTLDPRYDTREVLAQYAQQAGAQGRNWLFLRGEEAVIYHLAQKAYLSHAQADSLAPGGFLHSGHIMLLDPQKRIRGVFDGTEDGQMPALLAAIEQLLQEQP